MDKKILNSLLDYAREYMGADIPFNNKWIIENFLISERIKLSKQDSNCNKPAVSNCTCGVEVTTGWTEVKCCNICGKPIEGEVW